MRCDKSVHARVLGSLVMISSGVVLSACGGKSTAAHSSVTVQPAAPPATPTVSPKGQVAATPSSETVALSDLMLPTGDAQGAVQRYLLADEYLQLQDDALFNGDSRTAKRTFTTNDNVYLLEVILIPYGTPIAAASDYAQAKAYVSNGLRDTQHRALAVGDGGDEFVGRVGQVMIDNSFPAFEGICFREANVVVIVEWLSTDGVIVPDIGEAVAHAQDARLVELR